MRAKNMGGSVKVATEKLFETFFFQDRMLWLFRSSMTVQKNSR
jgi:hypothetical protein